jgi:hypothetical protein
MLVEQGQPEVCKVNENFKMSISIRDVLRIVVMSLSWVGHWVISIASPLLGNALWNADQPVILVFSNMPKTTKKSPKMKKITNRAFRSSAFDPVFAIPHSGHV